MQLTTLFNSVAMFHPCHCQVLIMSYNWIICNVICVNISLTVYVRDIRMKIYVNWNLSNNYIEVNLHTISRCILLLIYIFYTTFCTIDQSTTTYRNPSSPLQTHCNRCHSLCYTHSLSYQNIILTRFLFDISI